MEGSRLHILEELPKAGGSLDGENMPLRLCCPRWSWNGYDFNVCGTYSDLSLH